MDEDIIMDAAVDVDVVVVVAVAVDVAVDAVEVVFTTLHRIIRSTRSIM